MKHFLCFLSLHRRIGLFLVANLDCIVNRVTQSKQNFVDNLYISFPAYRDYEYPEILYHPLAAGKLQTAIWASQLPQLLHDNNSRWDAFLTLIHRKRPDRHALPGLL